MVICLTAQGEQFVHVDDMVVVVILHEDGFYVLEVEEVLGLVEVVHQEAEGLLFVVYDVVFLLVVLQFFVGEVREDVQVLVSDAFPFLGEQDLFLRDYFLGLFVVVLEVDLHVGDVAGVGGALEGDELSDVPADGEYHLCVSYHQEEECDAEEEQVHVAVLFEGE